MRAKFSADADVWRELNLECIEGTVRIVTYNLSSRHLQFVAKMLKARPQNIFFLSHYKFQYMALNLKRVVPNVRFAVGNVHGKILMYEPCTVYIGSANVGVSNQSNYGTIIQNRKLYADVLHKFEIDWKQAVEIGGDEDEFLAECKRRAPKILPRQAPTPLTLEEHKKQYDQHRELMEHITRSGVDWSSRRSVSITPTVLDPETHRANNKLVSSSGGSWSPRRSWAPTPNTTDPDEERELRRLIGGVSRHKSTPFWKKTTKE